MDKRNNIYIGVGLTMVLFVSFVHRSFIKNTILSLLPSSLPSNTVEPRETYRPDENILETYHNKYLEIMNNPQYGIAQSVNKLVAKIYNRDKDFKVSDPMDFSDDLTGNRELTIKDYFLSEQINEIDEGTTARNRLKREVSYGEWSAFDDEMNLKEQYTLLVIDVDITNVGSLIHEENVWPGFVQLYILDGNGEQYLYNERPNWYLRKTENGYDENYVVYDYQSVDTISGRYVFAIPKEVFDTDLQVCAFASIGSPLSTDA